MHLKQKFVFLQATNLGLTFWLNVGFWGWGIALKHFFSDSCNTTANKNAWVVDLWGGGRMIGVI